VRLYRVVPQGFATQLLAPNSLSATSRNGKTRVQAERDLHQTGRSFWPTAGLRKQPLPAAVTRKGPRQTKPKKEGRGRTILSGRGHYREGKRGAQLMLDSTNRLRYSAVRGLAAVSCQPLFPAPTSPTGPVSRGGVLFSVRCIVPLFWPKSSGKNAEFFGSHFGRPLMCGRTIARASALSTLKSIRDGRNKQQLCSRTGWSRAAGGRLSRRGFRSSRPGLRMIRVSVWRQDGGRGVLRTRLLSHGGGA